MVSLRLFLFAFASVKLLSIRASESYPTTLEDSGTHGAANLSSNSLEQLNITLSFVGMNLNILPSGFVKSEFLTHLTLESNQIETVSSSAFDFVPRLSNLSLANNMLQNINLDQFSTMNSLNTLNLNGNCRATEQLLPSRRFIISPGMDLKYVNSSQVIVSPCEVNLDARLPSLSELHLENNYLNRLTFFGDLNLPLLNRLWLSNNELNIDDAMMSIFRECMPSLSDLYLNNCSIDKFDASQLSPTVTSLYLDSNTISCICNEYCERPSLKLSGALKLKTLSLSRNQISKIEADAFNYTKNLMTLDLSYNRISEIREGTFDKLHSLQFLRLEFNALVKLNAAHTFRGLINLEHLSLGHNSVSTIGHESFEYLVKLKALELNNNRISDIASGTFSKLTSLEELSLAGNQLSRIPDGCMPTSSSLIALNLDSNEFASTKHIFLDNSPNLVTLSLKNNPLRAFSFRWHSNAPENLTIVLGNTCHTTEPSESMWNIGNTEDAEEDVVKVENESRPQMWDSFWEIHDSN